MSVVQAFHGAVELAGSDPSMTGPYMAGSRLAWAAARVLGAQGAGITFWSGDTLGMPWGASSVDAAVAEQAQATCGQGPCMDAFTDGQSVMASAAVIDRLWPGFSSEFTRRTPFRSVYAAPVGDVGALDVYFVDPIGALGVNVGAAAEVAEHILWSAARDEVLSRSDEDLVDWQVSSNQPRAKVSMAMGMLVAALRVDYPDALAILRGRAFADDTTIDDVAIDLVAGVIQADSFGSAATR